MELLDSKSGLLGREPIEFVEMFEKGARFYFIQCQLSECTRKNSALTSKFMCFVCVSDKKSWPVSVLQENRPELIDTSVETSQSTPAELLLRAARFGKNGEFPCQTSCPICCERWLDNETSSRVLLAFFLSEQEALFKEFSDFCHPSIYMNARGFTRFMQNKGMKDEKIEDTFRLYHAQNF